MTDKKAQVTAFIIIGIVLLLSTFLFFRLKGSIDREEIAPGVTMIVEQLPTEFLPVKPFVENCLEKTAKEGLVLLGQRGGYIYTDDLRPSTLSTEGNAVRFSRQSELILPYWYYLSSSNDCIGECAFESQILRLKDGEDSVEGQLSKYVEENLEECIDGFKGIEELGFEVEEGKPRVAEQ